MSTTRVYQDMLNEYTPNSLLMDEVIKRDWFLSNVQKDQKWLGGDVIVPFRGANASSLKFGGLTDSSDISQSKFVRGKISGYKEVWGSLIFNETDLMQHGQINEQNFLKLLPDELENFMTFMQMAVSINLATGPHFAQVVADNADVATGWLTVDRIDRFEIGQKFVLDDSNSSPLTVYVVAININGDADGGFVQVSLSRDGAAVDVSAYTLAQAAKCYYDGVLVGGVATNQFTSLKSCLLSAANGGSATIHGQTKLLYPYLQAINIDGSTISATNILDKIFDAFMTVRIRAKGTKMNKVVMSLKHLGSIMKLLQSDKKGFRQVNDTRVSQYNFTEIDIMGSQGSLTVVGIQEMDDDLMFMLDMTAFTFRSNGMMEKAKDPGTGSEFYRIRGNDGFKLITDIKLFGELECTKPGSCGVIHSVPNY
jgi:hypothetical protein